MYRCFSIYNSTVILCVVDVLKNVILQILMGHNKTHHKAKKLLLPKANFISPVLLIFKFFLNQISDS